MNAMITSKKFSLKLLKLAFAGSSMLIMGSMMTAPAEASEPRACVVVISFDHHVETSCDGSATAVTFSVDALAETSKQVQNYLAQGYSSSCFAQAGEYGKATECVFTKNSK
jgi:hypothetical protein